MTTRKRWKLIGLFAAVPLFVYVFPLLIHPPGSRNDLNRIRNGLPRAEVEAVLGKHARQTSFVPQRRPTFEYELSDGTAGIEYDSNDKVSSIVWQREQNRFWQTIHWLQDKHVAKDQ